MRKGALPMPRPFLKWAGGKRQILPRLLAEMPSRFGDYHEPFLGGGALFFELCRQNRMAGREVFLADSNAELIRTYTAVRDNVEGVIRILETLRYDEGQYYEMRAVDPVGLLASATAARMIYLNRTGFNGLYRVNRKGQFNVSWGRYTNPLICDADNLRAVSAALAGVTLEARRFEVPFEGMYTSVSPGAFVYLDPPYLPVSATSNFTAFTRDGFGIEQHEQLLRMFDACATGGALVLLSSSDVPWTVQHYDHCRIVNVAARRSVNSKATRRGPVGELMVASYEDTQLGLRL